MKARDNPQKGFLKFNIEMLKYEVDDLKVETCRVMATKQMDISGTYIRITSEERKQVSSEILGSNKLNIKRKLYGWNSNINENGHI